MKTITIEQARAALEEIYERNGDTDAAYFTLDEFINQMQHYIQTRNIMIPILLTKKE